MPSRTPWLVVASLLIAVSSASAQVKDAVELLPAQTPACLELRQPSRLAREIAVLVKGSALDDMPRRMAKMNDGREMDYRYFSQRMQLSMMSTFLCPEMIDEAGRMRGGFVALTGIGKNRTPEVVAVLQNGNSNLPGVVLRASLTGSVHHIAGEVAGVALYRQRMRAYMAPSPDGQQRFEDREIGPVLGQMPGLLLFGSSVDVLKGVISRAKSKSSEASLTRLRAFKDSAALRERPGLFAYVDVAALQANLGEQGLQPDNPASRFGMALPAILGKDALRNLTLSLTLQNGALEGRMRCDVNAKSDSPLLGLLPDRAAPRELLHFAPNDALLALASGFDDNEKRWKTLLNLLDVLYDLEGRAGDNRPSRTIQEMEKKLDFHIDKEMLTELTGAGLVVAKNWRHKPGQGLLLLRARDAAAAAKLEKDGLPRLFSLGGDEVRKPTESEVRGRKIKTLGENDAAKRFPFSVHYGRQGAVLAIGLDAERVAEALVSGGKKAGLLGETKVAEAVKEIDDKATAIGVLSSSQAALDVLAVLNRPPAMPQKMPVGAPPQPVEQPADKPLEESKAVQAFRKAGEPLVFSLHRQPESLVLEMRPLPLRRMTPLFLDAWVEALLKPIAEGGPAGTPTTPLPVPVDTPKR